MARVAFVSFFDEWATAERYLASSLEDRGHVAELVFLSVFAGIDESPAAFSRHDLAHPRPFPVSTRDMELLVKELDRFGADFVGMTVMSSLFDLAVSATEWIHDRLGLPVVWGGPDPAVNPESALEHADVVCVGEGEKAIVDLAALFDAYAGPRSEGRAYLALIEEPIPNLRVARPDGVLRGNEGLVCPDVDAVPFPLFDATKELYIVDGEVFRGERPRISRLPWSVPVVSSRGCPFSCSYCCHSVQRRLYRQRPYLRRRSPENVIAELARLKGLYPELSQLEVYDSVFTIDAAWLFHFADLYERHIRIPFWCYTYPGMAAEPVLRRLQEIGLSSVTFGIQAGSERICRDIFGRPSSRERVLETASILHRLGIPYAVDVIGSNPFETDEDRMASVTLLAELPKPYLLHKVSPLQFFPGYLITERACREGVPMVESHGSTMVWPPSSQLSSWDALMTLAQFPDVGVEALRALSRNDGLMTDPATLWNLALAMTRATYSDKRVYDLRVGDFEQMIRQTKDQRICELEGQIGSLEGSRLVRAAVFLRRFLRRLRQLSGPCSGGRAVACY